MRFDDPLLMPRTGQSPEERLAHAVTLAGTSGQSYVERRGVPLVIAEAAGVRFDADFDGRPAVLVPLRDARYVLVSLQGHYLQNERDLHILTSVIVVGESV